MQVCIFTDGVAKGNPGPGGFGAIIQYTGESGKVYEKEITGGYNNTTNNRMEIMAAIAELEALTKPCEVVLTSDSQYLVNAFHKNWITNWKKNNWVNSSKEPVKNKDLWIRLLKAMESHDEGYQC